GGEGGTMMGRPYRNRREAGRYLATKLADHAGRPDVLVLALPRGGVPVAYEVARALGAPLDVFLVRKLGVPGHEELALGAIATGADCRGGADRGPLDVRGLPGRGGRDRLRPDPRAVLRRRPLVRGLRADDRRGGPRPAPAGRPRPRRRAPGDGGFGAVSRRGE